jgi:ABC-2 type transport system permease protein
MLLPPRKSPSILAQLVDLTLMQLSNFRWSWRRMAITGMLVPTANIVMLGLFNRDSGIETLGYILVGNIVISLMFESMGKVSSNFAYMRWVGSFNYFATLPIHRYLLVIATLIAFALLALPALLFIILFGAWFLGVPLHANFLVFLVIPLIMIPLSSLGAWLGTFAMTPDESNAMTLVVTFFLLCLGPVLLPPDRLPEILHWLGRLSPATYAASALRQTLIGPITPQLGWDVAMLSFFAITITWLVNKRMEWRNE